MSTGDVVFAVILAILVIAVLHLTRTIDARFAEIRPLLTAARTFTG
jgi:hypothetical protein